MTKNLTSKAAMLWMIALFALVAVMIPASFSIAHAATCGDLDINGNKITCDNGSPEMVVNIWGTTNQQITHATPGSVVKDAAGIASICPIWFTNYCVDISNTDYYKNGARATARQLQSSGYTLGLYAYWLSH